MLLLLVIEVYVVVKDWQVYVCVFIECVDWVGEIVVQFGIDFINYCKIFFVFFNYNVGVLVVKCVDIGFVGGNLEVVVEFLDVGKVLFLDVVFVMICEGLIGGVFIGFILVDIVLIDKGCGV